VLYVFPWKGIRIPTAARDMREAQASAAGSDCRAAEMDRETMTSLDQQLEQMEALASRHYPDDEGERNACLVRLLKERLRTYYTMLQPLPVRQMKEDK
jgi:hypothetical protein